MIVIVSCTHSTKRYDIPRHGFFLCFHSLALAHWSAAAEMLQSRLTVKTSSADCTDVTDVCQETGLCSSHGSFPWFVRHRRFVQFLSVRMKVAYGVPDGEWHVMTRSQWDTGLPWHHSTCPHHKSGNSIWVKGWVLSPRLSWMHSWTICHTSQAKLKDLQGFANSGVSQG